MGPSPMQSLGMEATLSDTSRLAGTRFGDNALCSYKLAEPVPSYLPGVEELGLSTLGIGRSGFIRQLVIKMTKPAAMQTIPKMSATMSGQNSDHHWLPVRGGQPFAGQLVK